MYASTQGAKVQRCNNFAPRVHLQILQTNVFQVQNPCTFAALLFMDTAYEYILKYYKSLVTERYTLLSIDVHWSTQVQKVDRCKGATILHLEYILL